MTPDSVWVNADPCTKPGLDGTKRRYDRGAERRERESESRATSTSE